MVKDARYNHIELNGLIQRGHMLNPCLKHTPTESNTLPFYLVILNRKSILLSLCGCEWLLRGKLSQFAQTTVNKTLQALSFL